jgi:hypothetical protein
MTRALRVPLRLTAASARLRGVVDGRILSVMKTGAATAALLVALAAALSGCGSDQSSYDAGYSVAHSWASSVQGVTGDASMTDAVLEDYCGRFADSVAGHGTRWVQDGAQHEIAGDDVDHDSFVEGCKAGYQDTVADG